MNFLAHLHCSPNQELVRVFNFTGDGFRGNHWKSHATNAMIIGVELHRFIDSFTDEHPLSKIAKQTIRKKAGKTAAVALDLLGDYFLHKHWKTMRALKKNTLNVEMKDFIKTCTQEISRNSHLLQGKASNMWPHMKQENWLMSYSSVQGIQIAARGMSKRHPAVAALSGFFSQLQLNDTEYLAAEQWFVNFYPELLFASKDFILNHPLINK
jgi:acyl carrier protein phosphodiesterase